MSRKKFKTSRICSSENYEESRRIHLNELKQNHEDHINDFTKIEMSIKIELKGIPYVKAFGTVIPLSKDEVTKIEASLIIWK